MQLFEITLKSSDGVTHRIHWRAKSHLKAANASLDYAQENHIKVDVVEVSTMTAPDEGRPGLVYVVNDTRHYRLTKSGRLCRVEELLLVPSAYDVHIYAIVRVKVSGVEADSPENAARKAEEAVDLHELSRCRIQGAAEVEYAEDIQDFLIDVLDREGNRVGEVRLDKHCERTILSR
jgi:hypothetical protein